MKLQLIEYVIGPLQEYELPIICTQPVYPNVIICQFGEIGITPGAEPGDV